MWNANPPSSHITTSTTISNSSIVKFPFTRRTPKARSGSRERSRNRYDAAEMSVKTIDELPWAIVQVLAHWKNLDAKLAPGQLALTGNYGRPEMVRDLEELNVLTERILGKTRDQTGISAELRRQREELKEALRSFSLSVKGLLMGTPYAEQLPRMPDLLAHEEPFLRPMEQASELWKRINQSPPPGFAAPLVLASGLSQARFEEKVKAARKAFESRRSSIGNEREIRKTREILAKALRDRAIQYHRVVSGSFAKGSEEVVSLPRLWPPTIRKNKEPANA